jgi:tRNA A-37 threonylcarbamoyl transferase component Bud32
MNIIINIDLLDNTFENYNYPQPLINIFGKSILEWVIDYNEINSFNNIFIIHNNQNYDFLLKNIIKNNYNAYINKFKIFFSEKYNNIVTLNKILIENEEPILVVDTKNLFIIKDIIFDDNIIFYHKLKYQSTNDNYLFFNKNGKIVTNNLKKKNIKDVNYDIIFGAFYFKDTLLLKSYIEKIILLNDNIFNNNNLSLINVLNMMISENIHFNKYEISNENIYNLETPFNLRLFYNNYPKVNAINNNLMIKPKRIVFQLEDILISYKDGEFFPNIKNINYLKYLKKLGNTIIINTSYDYFIITILKKYDIDYDVINVNLVCGDYYINLNNVLYNNLEKSLGFYNDKIDPRDFNEVICNNNSYTKKSENLDSQIYYYLNIPNEIKDIFPILLDYDANNKWYTMESINGVNVSNLYTSEILTLIQFDHILGTINRIHNCKITDNNTIINIYANYSEKLKIRYNSYDYSKYDNSEKIYNFLLENLNNYESKKKGKISVIHGDAVFTNILINKFGKIKMIDMRGSIGSVNSIYGDIFYDYAKIYQSIIGYDEILKDIKISENYKKQFIDHFKLKFLEKYSYDDYYFLKIIVGSLLFTLIPLHNNDKCIYYYNLIKELDIFSLER